MTRSKTFSFFGSFFLAWVVSVCVPGVGFAQAAAPLVRDDANLFSAVAIDKVNDLVKEIHQKFGKDLTIQTFAAIPPSMQPGFAKEKKDDFYEHWVRREARAADTNGVFILIVKNPGHVQIGVGTQTSPKIFTFADRDELRDLMVKAFSEKKLDDGLINGAQFVLERMAKNTGQPANSPPPTAKTEPAPSAATVPAVTPAPDSQASTAPATQPAAEPPATKTALPAPDVKPPAPDGVQLNK